VFETRPKSPRQLRHVRGATPTREPSRAPETLVDVFAATVARHRGHLAIDAADGALTYAQLDERAAALSARLHTLGVGPGDRVGIRVPSGSVEPYVAILGVLAAGAAYVPVDHDDPDARAEQVWRGAEVCAVIGAGLEIEARYPARAPVCRPPGPDDEAWVIFTSGSTGEPKGVAITHRSAAAFIVAEQKLWTVLPTDRVMAAFSVGFDASCEEIWLAWGNGAALVPAPRTLVRAGSELEPWLLQQGVTVISTVPTLAALWSEAALCEVRLLILGGEACPNALGWRLSAGREVWNTYGPTEATVVTTAAPIRPGEPVSVGRPLRGWEVAVVDPEGAPVALGQPGELVIGGVGLGHYLDAELDATRFAPLPTLPWARAYRTGDIVRETIEGLEFVGRRDDQVKLGGRRLELGEIDAQLSAVPGVLAARSAVRESSTGNRLLVGYVVGDVDPARVRAHLAQRLPAGIVPVIVPLDELPRGASSKVDRDRLPWPPPQPDAAPAGGQRTAGLGSETAVWLAERWAQELGPLGISADSDFFALGGTSLAAAKLISTLRQRWPALAVSDLYEHRTLREFAQRLDELGTADAPAAMLTPQGHRRWGAVQVLGVLALLTLTAAQLLLVILAYNKWLGIGPQLGWVWLVAGWLMLSSAPGRSLLVLVARRGLLSGLRPGRYPRRSWLACRMWFVEALSEVCRLEKLAGTPWAGRYARLLGHRVGRGARLGTIPPATSLVTVGAGATLEAELDLHGWWLEGNELVIGEVTIGAGARIGQRSLLMPGAWVGTGAEIEPGSVISQPVPAGQRWSGSPARHVGIAGESWPSEPGPAPARPRLWKTMFALGVAAQAALPVIAVLPGLGLLLWLAPSVHSTSATVTAILQLAPLMAASFLVTYGLAVAGLVRAVSPLVRVGRHPDLGATAGRCGSQRA
jgi:amino acid adenylation domain-containing protein